MVQYHFTYNIKAKQMAGTPIVTKIPNCTSMNFPLKSFYSSITGNCLTFYRQGQCFTVKADDINQCKVEKITEADLGNMYLVFEQALVVRSSSSIMFFKINPETHLWEMY